MSSPLIWICQAMHIRMEEGGDEYVRNRRQPKDDDPEPVQILLVAYGT